MVTYDSVTAANDAGFSIEHREDEHRFVITEANNEVVGYAKYRLIGDTEIDFNGTVVTPAYRGTGLSRLLVQEALGHDIVRDRLVQASCWYVADAIRDHPEFLAEGATSSYA